MTLPTHRLRFKVKRRRLSGCHSDQRHQVQCKEYDILLWPTSYQLRPSLTSSDPNLSRTAGRPLPAGDTCCVLENISLPRDAVAVPGLSKAALDTLKAVQMAGLTAEIPREGERYDARQRRREELVFTAWREGRTDPRVANELDGFMAAASRRLGEEGMRDASRAASSGRRMELPGVGREHQAGLNETARSFVQGRDGMALSAAWDQRVEREAKETERQRAREERRQARGLPPEPEQERARQRGGRGLGLGR